MSVFEVRHAATADAHLWRNLVPLNTQSMSPELINAIKERLAAGQSREEIEVAVLAMGHTKEVCDTAFTLAANDMTKEDDASLPRARDLFKNAWKFTKTRFDLVILLFIPLALESSGLLWSEKISESGPLLNLVFLLLPIVTAVVYIATIAMTLRIVTVADEAQRTLSAAFSWMIKNILSLWWLYILSTLLIIGGFLLFIIPGLIVLVSTTFAQYIFVNEEKRGIQALLASRALVEGRWWKVLKKLFAFSVLALILIALVGFFFGIITGLIGENGYEVFVEEILIQGLTAIMSLIIIHAMYDLYKSLNKSHQEKVESPTNVSIWYGVLISLGFAFVAVIVVVAVFFNEKLEWLEDAATPIEDMNTREVPAVFSQFSETALRFANEQNGS